MPMLTERVKTLLEECRNDVTLWHQLNAMVNGERPCTPFELKGGDEYTRSEDTPRPVTRHDRLIIYVSTWDLKHWNVLSGRLLYDLTKFGKRVAVVKHNNVVQFEITREELKNGGVPAALDTNSSAVPGTENPVPVLPDDTWGEGDAGITHTPLVLPEYNGSGSDLSDSGVF